jgi:hypothetical protein
MYVVRESVVGMLEAERCDGSARCYPGICVSSVGIVRHNGGS